METEVSVKTTEPAKIVRPIQRAKERMPWQRLVLSVLAVTIILLKWKWAVWHLYSLPPESYAAFTSSNTNSDYAIAAIVIFMISGKMIYDWKNQTAATLTEQVSHTFEKKESKKPE